MEVAYVFQTVVMLALIAYYTYDSNARNKRFWDLVLIIERRLDCDERILGIPDDAIDENMTDTYFADLAANRSKRGLNEEAFPSIRNYPW
jgi:hypothetical protein